MEKEKAKCRQKQIIMKIENLYFPRGSINVKAKIYI